MAQLVVRNLDEGVKSLLRDRAARHGRSMEEEVREILRDAARAETPKSGGLGSEIAAMFSGKGYSLDLPKRRSGPLRAMVFDDDHS